MWTFPAAARREPHSSFPSSGIHAQPSEDTSCPTERDWADSQPLPLSLPNSVHEDQRSGCDAPWTGVRRPWNLHEGDSCAWSLAEQRLPRGPAARAKLSEPVLLRGAQSYKLSQRERADFILREGESNTGSVSSSVKCWFKNAIRLLTANEKGHMKVTSTASST